MGVHIVYVYFLYAQVVACLPKSVSAFYRKNNPLFGEWVDNQLQAYEYVMILVLYATN